MNSILSSKHEEFNTENNSQLQPLLNSEIADVDYIFKKYHYPVSSWPVLVEKELAAEIKKLSVRIPKLIAKIPELYFNNDVQKIADFYFGGDKMVAEFAIMCHEKQLMPSCRLDVTYTDDGFKVLEANLGSTIGGWQVQSFEEEIRSFHPYLQNAVAKNSIISRNTQTNYANFIIEEVLKSVDDISDEINIFLVLSDDEDVNFTTDDIADFFQKLMREVCQEKGYIINVYTDSSAALELKGKNLFFNSVRLHCVLDMDTKEMPAIVFRAHLLGSIYFPENLATNIYADKRNLALLRFLAEDGKFSESDNQLLLKSIPWTVEFSDQEVVYENQTQRVTELIKQKDEFVIKPFSGYQGKGVHVGKFLTDAQWEEAIKEGLNSGEFILQKFWDSKHFLAPNRNNEWKPHKLIWGMFGFQDMYAGVWVRMSEVATDAGVINSATGAIETIVYEIL